MAERTDDLRSLLAKVEGASGADRELDAEIARGLNLWRQHRREVEILLADHFTGSIDASLALVERVLPDAPVLMGLRQTTETIPWVRIGRNWRGEDAKGANLALAVCAALLTALIAQEEERS